jgi:hypothetical protein
MKLRKTGHGLNGRQLARQDAEIAALKAQLAQALARITQLEHQLAAARKNSSTSPKRSSKHPRPRCTVPTNGSIVEPASHQAIRCSVFSLNDRFLGTPPDQPTRVGHPLEWHWLKLRAVRFAVGGGEAATAVWLHRMAVLGMQHAGTCLWSRARPRSDHAVGHDETADSAVIDRENGHWVLVTLQGAH